MSDYLRRMADQLERHHREFHSAPVLDFSVIALRHGADRIEELEAENARLREDENPRSMKEPFSEYGHYGENNPPVGMSSTYGKGEN